MNETEARVATLQMAVDIDAPVEAAWKALTANMNEWWPESFFGGGTEGQRRVVLEAEPGGRMYEEWQGGGGLLWGTVVTVEPQKMLQILGHQFPNWGGPSAWYGTWEFSASGDGTRLQFSESAVGRLPDGYMADKDKGWNFLWATLKAHLEGTAAPEWSD